MTVYRLSPIKLSENENKEASSKIQVIRTGTFNHGGDKFQVTKEHLSSMVKNFNENIRGIDIMLDFSHNSAGPSAGWFKKLSLENDGTELWGEVEYTPQGKKSVESKEFRYVSADFNFSYIDNETSKNYGPTLLGAGLTNRPVVKNMKPTKLSEETENNKGNKMTIEELKKELEKANKKIAAMEAKDSNKEFAKKEKELEEKTKELAEKEKAIKLSEEKIEADKATAVKKEKFDKMLSEKKVVEAQRESFMTDNFVEFSEKAVAQSDLNFSEQGTSASGDDKKFSDSKTPAQDELHELTEKKVKELSISFSEAQDMVMNSNPKLVEAYEKEVEV